MKKSKMNPEALFNCQVAIKTESPLFIISDNQDGASEGSSTTTRIVKKKQMVDGVVKTIPYIRSSKIRGTLRRTNMEQIFDAVIDNQPNIKIPTMDVVNHNCGGADNYNNLSGQVKKDIRTLSPSLSIFGFSLAVSGKLVCTDFIPKINIDGASYSLPDWKDITSRVSIVKMPNAESVYLTEEQQINFKEESKRILSAKYAAEMDKYEAEKEKAKEAGTKFTGKLPKPPKRTSIQQLIDKEVVDAGHTFYGTIHEKIDNQMNEIEKGLVILAIEEAALKPLGAGIAVGCGLVTWEVIINGDSSIRTSVDALNSTKINIVTDYSYEVKEMVQAAKNYLENIHADNVIFSDALDSSDSIKKEMLADRVKAMQTRLNTNTPSTINLFDTLVGAPTSKMVGSKV